MRIPTAVDISGGARVHVRKQQDVAVREVVVQAGVVHLGGAGTPLAVLVGVFFPGPVLHPAERPERLRVAQVVGPVAASGGEARVGPRREPQVLHVEDIGLHGHPLVGVGQLTGEVPVVAPQVGGVAVPVQNVVVLGPSD